MTQVIVSPIQNRVEVNEVTHQVTVTAPGVQGPPGPQGPQGEIGGALTYYHYQAVPSDEWVITHNLNCYLQASCFDSTGRQIEGEVLLTSQNEIRIRFSGATGGTAVVS